MTAIVKPADIQAQAARLVGMMARAGRPLIEAELRAIAERPDVQPSASDAALMRACEKVGKAVDQLQEAKVSGVKEVHARVQLELAARHLKKTMERRRVR